MPNPSTPLPRVGEVKLIGCQEVPCASCPYRKDVPSGIWAAEEYEKLVRYDEPTFGQPAALFMCHQQNSCLCTGWVQSHANRDREYGLLALRLSRKLDVHEVSRVALMEPLVKLFKTGRAAMKHGMKAMKRPWKRAKQFMNAITRKRVHASDKQLIQPRNDSER